MPEVSFSHVVSCSSQDPAYSAANLLKDGFKKWKSGKTGEAQVSVVLQLKEACKLSSVHVGNEGSAFVEVEVGRSTEPDKFATLISAVSFMSPTESRAGLQPNRVRLFDESHFDPAVASKQWDRLRVVCTQPFTKATQYGLSFVRVMTGDSLRNVDQQMAVKPKIKLTPVKEEKTNFAPGSLFLRQKADDGKSEAVPSFKDGDGPTPTSATVACSSANGSMPGSSGKRDLTPRENKPSPSTTSIHQGNTESTSSNNPPSKSKRHSNRDNTPKRRSRDQMSPCDEAARKKRLVVIDNDNNQPLSRGLKPVHAKCDGDKLLKNVVNDIVDNGASSRVDPSTMQPGPMQQAPHPSCDKKNDVVDNGASSKTKVLDPDPMPPGPMQQAPLCDKKNEGKVTKKRFVDYSKLLSGVTVVLSGFQNPLRGQLRDKAIALGARYAADWSPRATHLIAAFPNTPKVNAVMKASSDRGRIVKADWLEQCEARRMRLPWRRFALLKEDRDEPNSEEETLVAKPVPPARSIFDLPTDSESSDDEPPGGVLRSDPETGLPVLPDFLAPETVFVDPALGGAVVRLLERYTIAFGGKIAPYMDDSVSLLLTDSYRPEMAHIPPSVPLIKYDWLLECAKTGSVTAPLDRAGFEIERR